MRGFRLKVKGADGKWHDIADIASFAREDRTVPPLDREREALLKRYGLERVPPKEWSADLWQHNLSWVDDDCTQPVRYAIDLPRSEYKVKHGRSQKA